jgi:hypothetical protein
MSRLAKDRDEWERFALASLELAPKGDVLTFVEAVDVLCTTARADLTGARRTGRLEGSPIR